MADQTFKNVINGELVCRSGDRKAIVLIVSTKYAAIDVVLEVDRSVGTQGAELGLGAAVDAELEAGALEIGVVLFKNVVVVAVNEI